MGYGSYTASDWTKLKTSRQLTEKQNVEEVFVKKGCDPRFNPRHIGTRECFDSEDHPHTTPIVVGLDVTGSMGYLAVKVAKEALNDLIMKLYSTDVIEDPALMCAAYGDGWDSAPLQVTQFESDIRIAEQLLDLYFENRGNGQVVPTCLWEFLSRHTNIDAINKRNEKGFIFTIGDSAKIREDHVSETIATVVGDHIPAASVQSILRETQKKFHVFHIMIGGDQNEKILNGHKIVIDRSDIELLPEIILGTIAMQKGKTIEEAMELSDSLHKSSLINALRQLQLVEVGGSITL